MGGVCSPRELVFKCSTRERILASITIPFLSAILKIIEKSFRKASKREGKSDTKFRVGEIVLLKTEMSKFPWARPLPILGQFSDRCISA